MISKEDLKLIKINPILDSLKLEKISDDIYFSEKYSGYISNSRLSKINPEQGGTPEEFFGKMKPFYSSSLQVGSAVHELVLQPDLFTLSKINKPTAKMGLLADKLYKPNYTPTKEEILEAAKVIDYYKGDLTENQINTVLRRCSQYWADRSSLEASNSDSREIIYLDEKSRETVLNCVTALNNNKYVREILYPKSSIGESPISEMEKAILLDIEVIMPNNNKFTLKLKSKLDNYTIDSNLNKICVNDVKTLGRILSEFNNNISKFRYNREIAMYSWLLSLCATKFYNLNNPNINGNYLVVSTIPNYYVKVVPMTPNMFKEGWEEFLYLLKLVAYYYNEGYRFN